MLTEFLALVAVSDYHWDFRHLVAQHRLKRVHSHDFPWWIKRLAAHFKGAKAEPTIRLNHEEFDAASQLVRMTRDDGATSLIHVECVLERDVNRNPARWALSRVTLVPEPPPAHPPPAPEPPAPPAEPPPPTDAPLPLPSADLQPADLPSAISPEAPPPSPPTPAVFPSTCFVPETAVRAVLQAFQNNDQPEKHSGLASLWAFTVADDTGQPHDWPSFAADILARVGTALINHRRHTTLHVHRSTVRGLDWAVIRADVEHDNGRQFALLFHTAHHHPPGRHLIWVIRSVELLDTG